MAAEPADAGSSKPGSSMADVYEQGELTPLQRHVAFFDRDKDGVIYPSETYEGFRAIGAGVPLSAFSALFINGLLGPKTVPENEKAPALKLPIYVKNIQKGKHGSDSGVYDANGSTDSGHHGASPAQVRGLFLKSLRRSSRSMPTLGLML
ncbi:hypothetical protein PVAP13_4KG189900 [Panicum virgatum]|uniref:Caleosin n=1 Tax=Panicum virgatum TaxID=38727 RepID=A0A8T0TN33_PANVG|nr:hypothetical protein PVAP13_4KG189900 [Panicum virgatum]